MLAAMRDEIFMTSARLGLRRFTPDDLGLLLRMNSDPEVTRFTGGIKDRDKTIKLLEERILAYYDEHPGLGIWAGVELATGEITGMHLLNHLWGEPDIQVGYLMLKNFWGKGYATEMAVRIVRYGFEELKLPQIVAITELPHVVSQKVLIKSGLHRKGERTLAHANYATCGPLAWFERDAADWLAEDAARQSSTPST